MSLNAKHGKLKAMLNASPRRILRQSEQRKEVRVVKGRR